MAAPELNPAEIAAAAKKLGWKRVLLEAPDGLKPKLKEVAAALKAAGIKVYVSASSCYGPCDIDYLAAEYCKVDGIIHLGEPLAGYRDFRLRR